MTQSGSSNRGGHVGYDILPRQHERQASGREGGRGIASGWGEGGGYCANAVDQDTDRTGGGFIKMRLRAAGDYECPARFYFNAPEWGESGCRSDWYKNMRGGTDADDERTLLGFQRETQRRRYHAGRRGVAGYYWEECMPAKGLRCGMRRKQDVFRVLRIAVYRRYYASASASASVYHGPRARLGGVVQVRVTWMSECAGWNQPQPTGEDDMSARSWVSTRKGHRRRGVCGRGFVVIKLGKERGVSGQLGRTCITATKCGHTEILVRRTFHWERRALGLRDVCLSHEIVRAGCAGKPSTRENCESIIQAREGLTRACGSEIEAPTVPVDSRGSTGQISLNEMQRARLVARTLEAEENLIPSIFTINVVSD
ncbi:hypothetical protein B0H11DRAFT_1919530 [Mycena galericulata]|nr:hypothetical protein B0H11DRAFT_1919530 [Mycena galericulata]